MNTRVVSYLRCEPSRLERDDHDFLHCKFVLIAWSDCRYFVVGSITDFRYHANLVERFCDEQGLVSAWVQRPDLLEVVDPEVRVAGGGHLEINPHGRRMKCFGVSKAYGVFKGREVAEIANQHSFFDDYRLTFAKF